MCKDTSYTFADWLHHGCPAGILRPGPLLDYRGEPSALLATLRHNALFEVLSGLRVHPIARSHVHRGIIPEDDPTVFRVAATFQPAEAAPISALTWHATDKHRVAFVINTADVHDSAAWERHATPANQGTLWGKGCILFVRAAPLSLAGKWRITLAPASPITGDVLVVLLHWIGNSFFCGRGHPSRKPHRLCLRIGQPGELRPIAGCPSMLPAKCKPLARDAFQ